MSLESFEKGILVESTLDKLTHAPVTSGEIKAVLPLMRDNLVEAGATLNLSESALESLNQPQFRSLDSGRGPGMVEALGEDKTQRLLTWCREQGGPRLKKKKGKPKEGTEGRGLRQLAADTILLLSNTSPSLEDIEKYTLSLNRRVKKGSIKSAESKEVKKHFKEMFASVPNIPDHQKWREFASVPPGSVKKLWKFLIGP